MSHLAKICKYFTMSLSSGGSFWVTQPNVNIKVLGADSCHVTVNYLQRLWTLHLSVNDCKEEILMTPLPILLSAPHDRRARAAEHLRHEINGLRGDLRDWSCYNEWLHGERWMCREGAVRLKIPWYNYRWWGCAACVLVFTLRYQVCLLVLVRHWSAQRTSAEWWTL